jgi:CBS domain-containing protein
VARRGYHLSREYSVDPLEILFAREVMRTQLVALPADSSLAEVHQKLRANHGPRGQYLYPLIDSDNRLQGVLTRKHLRQLLEDPRRSGEKLGMLAQASPVVAYPDEPLRVVVNRMADTGFTRFPVVDPHDEHKLLGMISLRDLLGARARSLTEERKRERVLRMRVPFAGERTNVLQNE